MRAPSSFTRLLYFTQFPVILRDSSKVSKEEYYCKFRLVPFTEGPLEGLPDAQDQKTPWNSEARTDDKRETDYLRKEIMAIIKSQSRSNPKPYFRLQVRCKLKDGKEGESSNIDHRTLMKQLAYFWSDVGWEDEPWVDFATVTLTSAFDNTAQQQMQSNVANLPSCFSIIEPTWSSHPAWIMYARARVYPTIG